MQYTILLYQQWYLIIHCDNHGHRPMPRTSEAHCEYLGVAYESDSFFPL